MDDASYFFKIKLLNFYLTFSFFVSSFRLPLSVYVLYLLMTKVFYSEDLSNWYNEVFPFYEFELEIFISSKKKVRV